MILKETSNVQGGTGSTTTGENNNYVSFKREHVEGTPFTEISEEGKGHYMVMGDFKMTENFETIEELREFVEKHKWNITLVMMSIVATKHIEANNKEQNLTIA